MRTHHVAIVGATGLVGRKTLQVLEERRFPVGDLTLLASDRSAGKEINFADNVYIVRRATPEQFKDVEIAFFATCPAVSKEFVPHARHAGALVVDTSSAFRMDEHVPLVIPEVNRRMIFHHKGLIANPNGSTIQMVLPLKPLHDRYHIRRIVVATYQSVTGAGHRAVEQMAHELSGMPVKEPRFPHRIAHNVLPQIDYFFDDGYSREEYKMMHETRKILEDNLIKISATCVRVPVYGGHSQAINVEFEKEYDIRDVRAILGQTRGVVLQDDPASDTYPTPLYAWDKDAVFVGRLRRDESVKHGLNLWVVADNLRKGNATNAVQIVEEWLKGPGH